METMKLFCPNCGAENDRNSAFCENCGADLAAAKALTKQTVNTNQGQEGVTCPNCGASNEPSSAFCQNCGADLHAVNTPTENVQVSGTVPESNEVICPNCGAKNKNSSIYCENCGADLRHSAPLTETTSAEQATNTVNTDSQFVFCPNCGTQNDASSTFCQNCGADLKSKQAPVQKKAPLTAEQQLIKQEAIYQHASELADKGNVKAATSLFTKLGDYKDAPEKAVANQALVEIQEQEAQELQQQGQYKNALAAFKQGNLSQAAATFSQLGDYQDSQNKLKLVQDALTKQQQQIQEQNQERAYQNVLNSAQQANNSSELEAAVDALGQFAGYKDADEQQASLSAKLPEMQAAEHAARLAHSAHVKKVIASVSAVLVVVAIFGGVFIYHSHTVNALNAQITQQRRSNAKSFATLPNTTQQDIRDMVATYHGNPSDYTYELKQKTANYNVVSYRFVGPDNSKDVLPHSGTRTYNQTAITKQ